MTVFAHQTAIYPPNLYGQREQVPNKAVVLHSSFPEFTCDEKVHVQCPLDDLNELQDRLGKQRAVIPRAMKKGLRKRSQYVTFGNAVTGTKNHMQCRTNLQRLEKTSEARTQYNTVEL